MERKLELLFIDSGYERNELNESINIDILLDTIDSSLLSLLSIHTLYCKLDEFENNITYLKEYHFVDVVFVSTKISSFVFYNDVENEFSNKPIFAGGVLATYINDELASLYKNTIYMLSEGETNLNVIIHILTLMFQKRKMINVDELKEVIKAEKVANICFWDHTSSSVYLSDRVVFAIEKNDIPTKHRTLSRVLKNDGLVRMETSRGCPWNNCSFCVMPWRYVNTKWRSFSPIKIEREIADLVSQGVKQILLTDEDFIGNKEHILHLCRILNYYNSNGINVTLGGSTSVYTLLKLGCDLDFVLNLMQQSGITTLFIGIESGSNSQLKRFRKGVTAQQNKYILEKLKKYTWIIDIGFIMFDAETTMDELFENLMFIEECNLQSNMSRFAKKLRIVPHTPVFEDYKNKGLINSSLDFNEMYYDYRFKDENISVIVSYLEDLDKLIYTESYNLQAQLRGAAFLNEKLSIENELSKIRNMEYHFLKECVSEYQKTRFLSREIVEFHYNKIKGALNDRILK